MQYNIIILYMEELEKLMDRAAENTQAKNKEEDRKERIRLLKQYEALQKDPTLATYHQPITREDIHTTSMRKSEDNKNKEITLFIHFHGGMIMNNMDKGDPDNELVVYNVPHGIKEEAYSSSPDGFFEAAHDAQRLVEPEKELYISDNCNPGQYSYTKTVRVIPIDKRQAGETDLLTQHIKNEYPLTNLTMSDLVEVKTYIEKMYTDDDQVHDLKRIFHEKFRIIYIHSIDPRVEIQFIENFIKKKWVSMDIF
ncbi:hypothetical protein [Yellowstone lake mimivirus]|uniref:hypothetical protein n=1 Tax=Yellowstone lake mimivirus TaxID=1586712 RepID=UPI0006EBBB7E|nr:hypothetical protein AR680_gp032 [Yellowstone lake mimivirus]BAT21956.1 hypothetical protein [Yellowstone lake mimivirus]